MENTASPPEIQLHDLGGLGNPSHHRSSSQATAAHQFPDHKIMSSSVMVDEDNHSRPQSPLSINELPLLQHKQFPFPRPHNHSRTDGKARLRNATIEKRTWVILLYCLPHVIPLGVAITTLLLNALEVYWQDLGRPNQSTILQPLQYGAKAHEITMAASLTAVVVHQTQYDLSGSKGVPLGFMTAAFQLSDPLFFCTGKFFGGAIATTRSKKGLFHSSALAYLLVLGFGLTLVVGPSSAVAMIPRLDWWGVSQLNAFGPEYTDRVYFNRTQDELWPANISNAIYTDNSLCRSIDTALEDCAVAAQDVVAQWVSLHQSQGTKPNITVFEDFEVTRYLTSQGGPPDNSSWTVSSTVGSIFTRDLDHYWDWLTENTTLPTKVDRPLIQPAFRNSSSKMKKPLVQAQCQTYSDPDWEQGEFEFPHDELLTPPLDMFKNDTWSLPNEYVMTLIGNDSVIGNLSDTTHPLMLFDWFDTTSNFSERGAPSLGAVVIYVAYDGRDFVNAMTTCSFDGRWAPVEYYLDPKDSITIYQDSPNPMDILNGSNREAGISKEHPSTTVVEQLLLGFSGVNSRGGSFIFPEPAQEAVLGFVKKSIDWRLSTTLGLYLTEGLARAFSDSSKGSMLFRQAPLANQSYVRYLNDINNPLYKEGYRDGKLDWVEMRDPRWNNSILPWDEWAPQNGYTEITFTIRRNGYGFGFGGVPIKLAATVLAVYVLLASAHIVSVLIDGRLFKGFSNLSEMLVLAWSSPPAKEVRDISVSSEQYQTWSQVVRAKEEEQRLQLVLEAAEATGIR